jgi:hypothetical protein
MMTELKRRWKASTPAFFRKVIKVGIAISSIGAGILASPVALPTAIITAGGYMVTVGTTAALVGKLTKI